MSDGGFLERVKGKAKELAGEVVGNDDLAREGRLDHAHGTAEAEANRQAARAERKEQQAEVEAERRRLAIESERLANEERAARNQQRIEREAAVDEAVVRADHERRAAADELAARRAEQNAEALRAARERS
jgi:uncharacterized protein YjbJ (UPF0337 family)